MQKEPGKSAMTFLSFCLFVRLTLIQSKGYSTFGSVFDAGNVFTMANKDKNRYADGDKGQQPIFLRQDRRGDKRQNNRR